MAPKGTRLVMKCFNNEKVLTSTIYSHVVKLTTIRSVLSIVAVED